MTQRRLNLIICLQLSLLLVAQAAKTSEPFYIIAQMVNTRAAVDWSLSQGANAIESDLQFNANGNPTVVESDGACDCWCAVLSGHICIEILNRKCGGYGASNDAAAHMQYVASRNGIALYYIDSKVKPEWGDRLNTAGAAVISFLDNNLFKYGYKGKVIISTPEIDRYNYIQAAVLAANKSINRERYFFTFDGEGDDYKDVIAMLSRLTQKRVYSTGTSACSPIIYESALAAGINGKSRGENGLTIAWTIDVEDHMRKLINLGVQGIMTNRVGVARQIVNSMGLTLASTTTSIPSSAVNVPSPYKCSCDRHNDDCIISFPAPSRKACKCTEILWACQGSVVSCDGSQPKCANPDESKEACQLGRGNCGGYRTS